MNETRKEKIRQYKEQPDPMGVYRITNTRNGKSLVGASMNAPGRLNRIKFELNMNAHRNRALQADWSSLGAEAFSFEVIDTLEPSDKPDFNPREELDVLEQLWIAKLGIDGKGYNSAT